MSDERFPKQERLRKRRDYLRVEATKVRRIITEHVIILAAPNSTDSTKIGITVSKKIGNAVKRNRTKRLLREIYRRNKGIFPSGYDIVLIARKQDKMMCYEILYQEIHNAFGSKTW